MEPSNLAGRRVVVTGASRGFGRAIAARLVDAGAEVIGIARSEEQLDELRDRLGARFTPLVGDVREPDLAERVVAEHAPDAMVLAAGATPRAARVQDHTWESFSENWDTDVRQVHAFCRAALLAPLAPGSVVISFSSGAALAGSPLSGGYAGAKAAIRFVSAYARAESERLASGIRFVSVLPKLTPATELGARFVDGYAAFDGVDRDDYLARLGPTLSTAQVAASVVGLLDGSVADAPAHLLTPSGLQVLA